MQKQPLILVSNDDGYFAPGLNALIDVVKDLGEVMVVAPEKGESGMSHALTIKSPLRTSLVSQNENLSVYKVNGTPVDCIKLASNQLLDRKPDLIVSGINHGSNSSISIVYSGTMGAAIEGSINNIPSIGFSLCSHDYEASFELAKLEARKIIEQVLMHGLPEHTCLNVNFPDIPANEFKGMKICRQAKGAWQEEFEKRTDPHGENYYWLTGAFKNFENGKTDSDEWALNNKYGSIVPVTTDYTNYAAIETLKKIL